jgi:hypothetical protein
MFKSFYFHPQPIQFRGLLDQTEPVISLDEIVPLIFFP